MNNESCCLCRRKGSRIVDENIAHLLLKLGFNNDPSFICVWCEKVLKKIEKFLQYIKLCQETIVNDRTDDYNPYIFTIQKLDSITIMPTFNEVYIDETVPEYHENSCTENDEMINCDWDNVGEKNSSTNTDFEVIYLSQEEQLEDIENKKKSDKYMNKKYKCELCGVGFLTDDVLQEHNFRHSYEAGDFICAICKLHFKTNLVLAQHKLAHRRRFKCVLCKKRFKKWSHALGHGTKCGAWDNVACDVCEKVFRDNNSLNIHKKIHTKERNFICDECNKGFRTRQHLIIHLRSHTGVKPFGCTECDKTFSTHSNLKAHSIVHEKEKLFFCVECNKRYKSEKSLRRHFVSSLKHVQEREFSCAQCDRKFISQISLSSHIRNVHLMTYKCNICEKYNPYIFTIQKLDSITIMPTFNEVYIDETVPEYHENSCTENDEMINCDWDNVGEKNSSTNTDFEVIYLSQEEQLEDIENKKKSDKYMNKKYKCELCGVGFLTDDVLQEHNFRHSYEAGDFICAICKLHFKTNLVLAQHKLAHRRRFKCVLCKKRFKKWSHALGHGTKCGAWDNVACDVCEKVFRDNNSLNIHKKIHTKERNFICDECNKGFRTRQHLIIHLRSHTGVKPFGCTECDKTFSTHSNLKAHSIVHEKEKLFFCVECNKRYKSEKSLRRHFVSSLKHVQEREFSCAQCDRKFISQISLSSHIRNVHLMTYKCNICEKIFSNNSNLKKHVRCVHSKS